MNVLLIEDNRDDQRLVCDYLAATGGPISVELFDRLQAGLDRLAEGGVDAALLDLFLPDSEGLETFVQIHSRSPHLPIVVLTGLRDEEIAAKAVRQGAQDYLRKDSLSPEILIRALRYAFERKQLEQRLRLSQRMETVGRLAGGAAHEFNNLLGVIVGRAEILLDRLPADDPNHRSLEAIKKAAGRAAALTRQLLAFSRRQVLGPQILDLRAILAGLRELLGRSIGEDIDLAIEMDEKLRLVKADRSQIEQGLINLIFNARDAVPHGGRLTIQAKNAELASPYVTRDGTIPPGSYVMLAVADTGGGITPETQARFFEPSFTAKEKGTGLGLATTCGIIHQSGGHICVSSEPGRGATFTIYLPVVNAAAGEPPVPEATPGSLRGTETILVVEDDPALREITCEFLRSSGYAVLQAGTPEEALRVAAQHSGTVHCLLTDVVLPGKSGPQLAERLAANHPELKVLYVSGYADEALRKHPIPAGKFAFLQKPCTHQTLGRKIRELLDEPAATGRPAAAK